MEYRLEVNATYSGNIYPFVIRDGYGVAIVYKNPHNEGTSLWAIRVGEDYGSS